jgi:hypothetical protein
MSSTCRWRCDSGDFGNCATGDVCGARRALAAYDADVAAGFVSVIAMDPAIVEKFEVIIDRCHHQSPPVLLRTLDAIHLASASVAAESEVVATDKRLREAALSLGFSVYPFP